MAYTIKYGDTLTAIARANNTSVSELLKANPQIKDPNKISAGSSLNLTGATVAPAAPTPQPTTKTPTIAEKASLIPDATPVDPAVAKYQEENKKQMETPIDEKAVRDEIRNRYNSQFDALRIAAAQKIAGERKLGEGRLGSARALQARSGTLGSNFAGAENDQVNRDTEDIVNSVNAETEAKIAFLMGQSEKDYSDQIAQARAAKQKGADEYIKYLGTRDSERVAKTTALAKLFAVQGIDPSTLSADEIKKLTDTYGTDIATFKGLVTEEKNKIQKDDFFALTDGQARYKYDPVTGKATLIAENNKNFAPSKYNPTGGGGTGTGTGGGKGGSVSGLSYDDPNYLDNAIAKSKGGRLLTQSEALPLTKAKTVLGQTETILGMIKSQDTGPIIGAIRSNNPYDTKAQTIKAALTSIVPGLARGVYGEVGVLTDSDVERYTKTIASLSSTADVNKAVMGMTLDVIAKSMGAQLESMAAAGRDVSGYGNIYKDMTKRVNAIKQELESKTTVSNGGTAAEVTVKAKDGRVITIPQDKLKEALTAGYVQVK